MVLSLTVTWLLGRKLGLGGSVASVEPELGAHRCLSQGFVSLQERPTCSSHSSRQISVTIYCLSPLCMWKIGPEKGAQRTSILTIREPGQEMADRVRTAAFTWRPETPRPAFLLVLLPYPLPGSSTNTLICMSPAPNHTQTATEETSEASPTRCWGSGGRYLSAHSSHTCMAFSLL